MKFIKQLPRKTIPTKGGTSTRTVAMAMYECPGCANYFNMLVSSYNKNKTGFCHSCSRAVAATTHGGVVNGKATRLYGIWQHIKQRRNNPKGDNYARYGGRGITVCKEWTNDFSVFKAWAVGAGYSKELSIDRRDNDKGYSPSNCRWATDGIQAANQGKQARNSTGYIGVEVAKNKWVARIRVNKTGIYLGSYSTPEEAARVRDAYIIKNNLPHTLNKFN
jgi:hypothetical protein